MTEPIKPSDFGQFMFWQGNDLHIDVNDPRAAKLRKKALSPSTYNSFTGCQSRWATEQLLPFDLAPMDPAPMGNSQHAVLEDLFSLPPDQRTQDAAAELIYSMPDRRKEIQVPTGVLERSTWTGIISTNVAKLWDIIDPKAINVVETERHVEGVLISGVPFNGHIDMLTDEGIIDWKFPIKKPYTNYSANSKKVQKYPEQLRIYNLALIAMDGKAPPRGEVIYVPHGIRDRVEFDPASLEATKNRFVATWADLNKAADIQTYTTTKSPLCGWCPMALVCPTAISGEKPAEAKVPKAELGVTMGIEHHDARRTSTHEPVPEPTKEDTMTDQPHNQPATYTEDRAWIEKQPLGAFRVADTDLNPNSYLASGLAGFVSKSYELLARQGKVEMNPETIEALATSLHSVTVLVQDRLIGPNRSPNNGVTTRIRGALYTFVDQTPPPFGGDEQAWKAWLNRAVNDCLLMVRTIFKVYTTGASPVAFTPLCAKENIVSQ